MVCGTSSDEERRTVQQRLRTREINFIFVADLYNEGVDIPEVDTVLFLRPTESLTIYLQQLGRGLRLCRDKEVLTVLDFIGSHRREFRFDRRLRALLNVPVRRVDDEVERGFPHLPVGCSMQLERVARDRVLENIRSNLTLRKQRIIEELRECKQLLGRPPPSARRSTRWTASWTNFCPAGSGPICWRRPITARSRLLPTLRAWPGASAVSRTWTIRCRSKRGSSICAGHGRWTS